MRSALVLAALLTATSSIQASITTTPLSATTPEELVDSTRAAIQLGYQYARRNDLSSAAAAFGSAIQSSGFARLPEEERYQTLLLAGQIAEDTGKHQAAHVLLVQASESSKADSLAWHSRLAAAFYLQDYRDSAECVTAIARRWPDTLGQINDQAIYAIEGSLDADQAQTGQQQRLLQALFDAKWTDDDGEPSQFWRDLTRLLLKKGDMDGATMVAGRIRSARVALSMRVDKRFDPITQANPSAYDVDRLVAAEIAAARAQTRVDPGELRPWVLLQGLLLDTLQYDEALAIADDIIARVRNGQGTSIYSDFNDEYPWLLDRRANTLEGLGRWDEAVRQRELAARRPEGGVMNVSQVINLGALYANLQRSEDALDAVSEVGPMSAFGRMQLESVRLQATLQQGDETAAARHMAYLREHRTDAIAAWGDALLLQGDLDAAADVLVERLRSDRWLTDALVEMQQYADVRRAPADAERLERWRAMLAKPKVLAALDKVGRIERFNLAP